MTNHFRSLHDSIKRFIACSKKNSVKVDVSIIPDYPAEEAKLIAKEAQIDAAGAKQAIDTSGAVDDNLEARRTMAKEAVRYCSRGAVKARNAGNHKLAEQLAHRLNYILKAPKGMAVQRTEDMRDALSSNLTICSNVTAANVTTISNAIAAFKAIETEPVDLIKEKKAQGTDLIPTLIKEAGEIMDNMYDLVYSYYFDTDMAVVDEFKLAMQVIDTGVHHTGIIAFIVNANPPAGAITNAIQNIKMRLVELDYYGISDINGLTGLAKFKPGTYHVEFSGDGWVTKTLIITFKRGVMLEMEIQMQRVTA